MRALLQVVPRSGEAPAQSFRFHVGWLLEILLCNPIFNLTQRLLHCLELCDTFNVRTEWTSHHRPYAAGRPWPRLEENKALGVHVSSYDAGLSHDRPLAEDETAEPHIPEPSPPAHLGIPCARFINRMQLHPSFIGQRSSGVRRYNTQDLSSNSLEPSE